MGKGPAPLLTVVNITGILVVTTVALVALGRLRPILFTEAAAAGADGRLPPADRKLLDDIRQAVEADKGYREEGLTIGGLAGRLGAPEHRVRRAINRHLGFRNFNQFLNHYRVAEARARLVDPDTVHLQVLTIALDAGYRSLGPFNRAFKELTGMTPAEYRKARFGAEQPAESEKS